MTITNDERRDVAARLRNALLTEGASQYMMEHDCDEHYAVAEVVLRNLRHLLGFNEIYSVHDVAQRLADLIEPEPERTCKRIEKDNPADNECSECGFYLMYMDSYCPNCGARVVDKED